MAVVVQPRSSRFWRYAPLLFWMALIFFASTGEFSAANTNLIIQPILTWLFPHLSSQRIAEIHFFIRKCAHFSEYFVLGWLTARAFIDSSRATLRRHWLIDGAILICLYALADEFHQSFVASRTASIYDSFIDMSGGICALVLFAWWRGRRRHRAASPR